MYSKVERSLYNIMQLIDSDTKLIFANADFKEITGRTKAGDVKKAIKEGRIKNHRVLDLQAKKDKSTAVILITIYEDSIYNTTWEHAKYMMDHG